VVEAPKEAVFVCEFEAYPMERGDVVISPPWTYHDHFNQGTTPAIFVDGYDNGYNPNVNVNEKMPGGQLYEDITRPEGYTRSMLGHMRPPAGQGSPQPFPLPPMRYPWSETQAALGTMRASEAPPDPHDGYLLMFASPVDGGATLPTMAWQVQQMGARFRGRDHRHNSTSFYYVFEGEGSTVVGDETIHWQQSDIFAVPPWTWHHHENPTGADVTLFSIDDWPAMQKLGFYMSEDSRQ
jgi:gentisate 1,2-dioxygenase